MVCAVTRRRRTPADVRRRKAPPVTTTLATATLATATMLTASACSGGDDARTADVRAQPVVVGTHPSGTSASGETADTGGTTGGLSPTAGPVRAIRLSALLDYPSVFAALAVVPDNADVVTYTDVAAVKRRLGYAHVTGESPSDAQVALREKARSDGAMFTGTRLDDVSAQMALDYGWTGADVDWEVDFLATEDGCLRSMLCDTGHGSVLGLRHDLDWSVVTSSLASHGFIRDPADPEAFRTDDPDTPFTRVRLIPELHAVAAGNEIGLKRLGDVLEGARSFGPRIGAIYDHLGSIESLHVSTGCVDLAAALGPHSTSEAAASSVTSLTRTLAPAETVAVVVRDRRTARIEVDAGAGATAHDLRSRLSAMRSWPGRRTGVPFNEVADVHGRLDPPYESFAVDVARMPELRAMVRTGRAPWALCPTTGP